MATARQFAAIWFVLSADSITMTLGGGFLAIGLVEGTLCALSVRHREDQDREAAILHRT